MSGFGNIYDFVAAHVRSAWRYRWRGVQAAWIVCLLGWLAVGLQKDVYQATARVYVDTSSELRKILGDQIVESGVDDQLKFVRQALLGSIQLREVAERVGLLDGTESEVEVTDMVYMLRQEIRISDSESNSRQRRSRQPEPTGRTYSIAFQYPDRDIAESVVATLLEQLKTASVGGQLTNSTEASGFLEAQIVEYEQRLNVAEDRLAEFNKENHDKLPNMQGGYFTRLEEESVALDEAEQSLRLAESRLDRIQSQLSGEAPQMIGGELDPTSLAGRIVENQRRLDDLLLRFTDNHPHVQATQEILKDLRARQVEELASGAGNAALLGSNNPVYQALLIAKNEVDEEIAALQFDVASRSSRLTRLRALIDEMPGVEAELAELNRDYEVVKEQYESLLVSLERDRLSRDVFTSEQFGFRIIDPPSAGTQPVAPNRIAYMGLVVLSAFGAIVALPYLLGEMNPVPINVQSLAWTFRVPVIGSVPIAEALIDRRQQIQTFAVYAVAVVLLCVVSLALAAFEVLGPGLRSYV